MNQPSDPSSRYCPQCGHAVVDTVRFCESCGAAVTPALGISSPGIGQERADATPITRQGSSRGRRVGLAIAIVAGVAIVLGVWIRATWKPVASAEPQELPSAGEAFPIKPVGIDSINNTIDGKKIAIEGDGHIMNSPGLGVNRPVWCLVGPEESVFTVPVGKTTKEGKGTFSPGFQVLVPVLREEVENPKEVDLRLTLIDLDGEKTVAGHQLKGENRWQPLDVTFPYDSAKAPYQLRFEARGFKGAIYIDRLAPKN